MTQIPLTESNFITAVGFRVRVSVTLYDLKEIWAVVLDKLGTLEISAKIINDQNICTKYLENLAR